MEDKAIRRRRGLFIYGGNQSANSIKASKEEIAERGVDLDLLHYTRKFSKRFWRYMNAPVEDAHIITALSCNRYDFLLLGGGDEHMRRPYFLRLLTTIANVRSIPIYVRWGACHWILQNKRTMLGEKSFNRSISLLSSPHIRHLTLTPHSARDLEAETGIAGAAIIFNSKKIPTEFLTRVPPQDDPPLVINVATVQPRKGPDLFVEIAAKVCEQHPTVRFVWIGGSDTPQLCSRIQELGLSDRVEFIGKVFPAWEWMRRASAMLLTSRSEAFGLCIAEAMACYRTACVFAGTGAADAVGSTGIVVEQFNTTKMAQHILDLLRYAPHERINDGARKRYDEIFAPGPFADRLCEVIMGGKTIK